LRLAVSVVQGRGRKGSEIAIPMELLSIKRGQKKTGLLIGDQQARLVKIAAQRPEDKRKDIGTWIQKSSKGMAKSAQSFGITVDNKPSAVNGRLLPAPVIEYAQPSHYYAGTTGAWNMKDVCILPHSPYFSFS
jgi:eukaryotic translation initiation factor 2C